MATTVARMEAVLTADTRRFDQAMGRAETKTERFGKIAKGALIGGAAAGLYAFGKAAKIGWDEFNEGQRVAAQTNAVIKSTGAIANVTAQQVEDLGTALMLKSGIDDEVIKSGENMLLTFRNIRNEAGKNNDIFNQATKLTLDLSVAMGRDMTSSAVMVGKALNDPIRGMTALTRVGVTFDDQQREMITRMVEAGNTMGAQKVILQELQAEFGGSARAAGKTFGGQLNILRERMNNFLGLVVEKAIPVLQQLARRIVPRINEAIHQAQILAAALRKNWNDMAEVMRRHQDTLEQVAKALNIIIAALKLVIRWNIFMWGTIIRIWVKIADVIFTATDKIIGAFRRMREIGTDAFAAVRSAVGFVTGRVQALSQAIQNMVDKVKGPLDAIADAFRGIGSAVSGAASHIPGIGDGLVSTIGGFAPVAANPGGLVPSILDDLGLAQSMGLTLSSGYRPGAVTSTGNPSLHGVGKAIDVAGSEAAMRAFFLREVARGASTGLQEIIHSPYWWHPGIGVTAIPASAGTVLQDHYNHVHVGTYDKGGWLRPGWNLAYNGLGRPERVGGGNTNIVFNSTFPPTREQARQIAKWLEPFRGQTPRLNY